jgi:tellurite methyltransferase
MYRGAHAPRSVNKNLLKFAHLLKRGRMLDLAGGIGQNALWLAEHFFGEYFLDAHAVVADISDEALSQASPRIARVLCDANVLPFPQYAFDTILCTRFYDARVNFSELLTHGGTVFFETFTQGDLKYRPAFNPAHRFDVNTLPEFFTGLEILFLQEDDDGTRVYVTAIGRKPI